jgi:predicted nucleic acid-binding protein
MRELIIDTNALISFVTDRNLEQQEKVSELFLSAGRLQTIILCPQHVITEFVYVLEKIYGQPKDQIRQMVADLIALPGIQIIHETDFNWVLKYWPEKIGDYGDALLAAIAKVRKEAQIVTFDQKLISALKKVGLRTAIL